MATKKSQKIARKYECSCCDYTTSKKYDYEKHLATDKHRNINLATDGNNSATKMSQIDQLVCNKCNKTYKCRTGLWRHKNKGNCDLDEDGVDDGVDVDDGDGVDVGVV